MANRFADAVFAACACTSVGVAGLCMNHLELFAMCAARKNALPAVLKRGPTFTV
jgi:hypothetical protein